MPNLDRGRQVVSAVAVVAALVLAPGAAIAKFTGTRAPALSVATDQMETPAGVTGTFACSSPASNEAVSISVTGFTDAGPAGSSYTYRLSATGATTVTISTTSHAQTISNSRADDNKATTWTLSIQSVHGNWTGTPFTKSIVCNRKSSTTGSL
ncbi:hypothetical protein ACT8ZV_18340 [Nocardioides sp. MAHUQ-72]|uniref:hypothetical protein n=1 Tax=unclassified Nocardioides TaxID=2615069 RepID=UPI00360E3722